MQTRNTKQKLSNHISLKSLTRTPSGNIYHKDLKNIFSVLLYCLDLKAEVKKPTSTNILKFSFKKLHPYAFTIEKAIEVMSNLNIDLQYHTTLTKLSYNINFKFAFELLQLFYTAKLLHCPDDKTCKKLTTTKHVLQPTPKGVAILYQFCIQMGIPNIKSLSLPEILKSNFNSMKLMEFERHPRTDAIIHSENSDKLLFIQVMGADMNIWSPKNGPDEISNIGANIMSDSKINSHIYGASSDTSEDVFNPLENENTFFEYLRQRQQEQTRTSSIDSTTDSPILESSQPSPSATFSTSPFFHRFFTNPDSDSHVQYYVSNAGLRFFKKKVVTVSSVEKEVYNCFSGKALIQYIMDCTDLFYLKEAVKVANMFVKLQLIKSETTNDHSAFIPTKDALYTLSDSGIKLVQWDAKLSLKKPINRPVSPSKPDIEKAPQEHAKDLILDDIIKDPGLKFLFRNFMEENMCIENMNIYDEILDFQKKMDILKKMLSLKDREKTKFFNELRKVDVFQENNSVKQQANVLRNKKLTIYTAMNKLSEYCLSKVYTIFSMYISENAPNEINIDSQLRISVRNVIEEKVNFGSPCMDISDLKNKLKDNMYLNSVENFSIIKPVPLDVENESADSVDEKQTTKSLPQTCDLTLKLKHLRDLDPPPLSPTDVLFGSKLDFLDEIYIYFEQIRIKVYRMMETDSLGKFLHSKEFLEKYNSL